MRLILLLYIHFIILFPKSLEIALGKEQKINANLEEVQKFKRVVFVTAKCWQGLLCFLIDGFCREWLINKIHRKTPVPGSLF